MPLARYVAVLAMLAMPYTAQSTELTPGFGYYSLAKGQVAQLNVAPPSPIAPNPCEVTLKFFDEDGNVFMDEARNEVLTEVLPGTGGTASANLRLPFNVAILSDGRSKRIMFRPVVAEDNGRTCEAIIATLEVYDLHSGKTLWTAAPPSPILPPSPN